MEGGVHSIYLLCLLDQSPLVYRYLNISNEKYFNTTLIYTCIEIVAKLLYVLSHIVTKMYK